MAKWIKDCPRFGIVREMIDKNDETIESCKNILNMLIACCNDLMPDSNSNWEFYGDFETLREDIKDMISSLDGFDYEECENETDCFLREFYNLCNCARVWLPLYRVG